MNDREDISLITDKKYSVDYATLPTEGVEMMEEIKDLDKKPIYSQGEPQKNYKNIAEVVSTVFSVLLLYYRDDAPFLSVYSQSGLAFMVWLGQKASYDLSQWLIKYKQYFNPKTFVLHKMMLLFQYFQVICILIWYCGEFILCITFMVANDGALGLTDFDFGWTLFMILKNGLLLYCVGCCCCCIIISKTINN